MDFDAVLIAPRRAASVAAGHWQDRTINDYLAACVRDRPDATALTALSIEREDVTRFTWRELARMADRVAVGLSRLGIVAGDVVSCQLPNGWHLSVLYLACARLGAVLNPVMPIFRERELSFMLAHAQSKVVVVPKAFRGFDHAQMLRGLRDALPALRHVVVMDGDGDDSFEALLSGPAWEDHADAAAILLRSCPGPDDVTQLIYTSGTTGEPKGVMHSANTLFSNIVAYAGRLRLTCDDVVLMASPMAHQTGFMYGLMMPVMLGAHAVLQDIWDPARAAALIRDEGVTFTMGSTPFLTDLARVVAESGVPVPSLRIFLCAGAPIPGALVEQARQALGAKIVSAWGMTENGAVTTTLPEDSDERASTTDGRPLPGVAIRVVDGTGAEVPAGATGRLLVRACSNFGGYLKRPQLNGTDADGWFDTGDLARLNADGYLRIAGRSKDVIIRGGENIPVLEVETLLYRHPAVAQVAIVAYPDARLGERACAFVVPRAGQSIDLAGMVDWLKQQKMALQYIPEKLVVRDALPATPAGKIQKFRLREMLLGDAG
ncbi:cyclohexanecarboxylate-CoA ligase [Cupriavidus alkaliphilus]|uniref:Cyclohexanecarboxylate-CoA ligase n=1 Tax=Cupriavidus alkaliphilus TaxID=942866 RepID=A0A7W4V9S5_9BURK|nr:cyclohexanecarboxylate-CoA ligase [Cupriavidus alkaliphilus]MBB3007676.1 cyclohexanecarboxylate-CoA ligase [Cupriavidus alkaliphilus]PVY70612.1 cyclohexanecarboxylate-CoA ligase [Cupriavidus alkaliphilus]